MRPGALPGPQALVGQAHANTARTVEEPVLCLLVPVESGVDNASSPAASQALRCCVPRPWYSYRFANRPYYRANLLNRQCYVY